MAVRTSRRLVIESPPEAIMDALADVRLAVRVLGVLDEEILEFCWGPNSLVWDAEPTKQQHAQHVEYTIPDFFIKRASKSIIDAATDGLRERVLRGKASINPSRSE